MDSDYLCLELLDINRFETKLIIIIAAMQEACDRLVYRLPHDAIACRLQDLYGQHW